MFPITLKYTKTGNNILDTSKFKSKRHTSFQSTKNPRAEPWKQPPQSADDETNQPGSISTDSKQHNRIKLIMNQSKDQYLEHWRNETKSQSRLNCYLALNREYKLAEYLQSVRDTKQRRILTNHRLSDQLAVETGSYRQTWRPERSVYVLTARRGR